MEQFLQFKACKAGKIDTIGIEVAQQIKLSGCQTKGYFTTKSAKNAILVVKWSFVGQPDNFICRATSMPMASIFPALQALNCKNCSIMVNWILVEIKNDNFLDLVFGFFKKYCFLFFPPRTWANTYAQDCSVVIKGHLRYS